jgi:hypothetical protein
MAPATTISKSGVLVHPFYRIWFTWVDPFMTWLTVVMVATDPNSMMEAWCPPELATRQPMHDFVLHQLAGLFAFLGVIITVLLRYTSDIGVWRIVQAGILAVDVTIVVSMVYSLGQQGRLDPSVWRGMDWMNAVVTVGVGIIRALFLLGLGNKTVQRGKKA